MEPRDTAKGSVYISGRPWVESCLEGCCPEGLCGRVGDETSVTLKFSFFFRDRVGKGERNIREGERNTDVREKHQLVASCVPPKQELNLQPRYVP